MSMALPRHFILATAGHVDHGKTALVKALTGIDPDRLPEEKARGITIDLGFAHLGLQSADGVPIEIGVVDVPGHEDFVKNMVAGVGSIDVALLVIAADDGWMPQTEEHLQILSYLSVPGAVVALTKIDLAEADEAEVAGLVRDRLRGSCFADARIVPTSTLTGRGLPELRATLTAVFSSLPPPREIGKPRLPVDRVFSLKGIGTIVTGTLTGGVLAQGQNIVVHPSGQTSRIRSVQSHGRDVLQSPPGSRTALNLPDLPVRLPGEPAGVQRGETVTLPGLGKPSSTLDVILHRSDRTLQEKEARPLKDGTRVQVHHGSGHFAARVVFLVSGEKLAPGSSLLAQLRSETPVFAFVGDHFIVRDWAEQTTLAGGTVLDADSEPRRFRSAAQRQFLAGRQGRADDPVVLVRTQLQRDHALRRAGCLAKTRFSEKALQEAADQLARERGAVLWRDWVLCGEWANQMRLRLAKMIDAAHREHPEQGGVPVSELRRASVDDWPAAELFDWAVTALAQEGFVQRGQWIGRSGHRAALPPRLQAAGQKLRQQLQGKPLEPPSRKELVPDAAAQQALKFLVETGEAIEINAELVISADGFQQAAGIVRDFLLKQTKATVSELRQVLGTSRRVVVPLLERFDKDGLTRREADYRVLRPR